MAVLPPTNWENLPDFTFEDAGYYNTLAPKADTGYDVYAVKRTPERTAQILEVTNGVLANTKQRMRFFINEIELGIGLAGTWGQGRRIRDFYPQAFTLPTYTIRGQSITQEDYGLLCEFIHNHQQDAVGSGNTIYLSVREGIPYSKSRGESVREKTDEARGLYDGSEAGGNIAGWHAPIEAEGFILEMPREHERFVFTPTWSFTFSVMFSHAGIFAGAIYDYETVQKSIIQVIEGREQPFQQVPKTPEAKKAAAPAAPTPIVTQKQIEQYNEELSKYNQELKEGKEGLTAPQPPLGTSLTEETKRNETLTNQPLPPVKPPKPKVPSKKGAKHG